MIATIGHNKAPDDLTVLRERLADQYRGLIDRTDELTGALERAPKDVGPFTEAKMADFAKQVSSAGKDAEAARVKEKEPYMAAGRGVDAWFRAITDTLDGIKREVSRRLTAYQIAKAESERREREEQAKRDAETAAKAAAAIKTDADMDAAIAAENQARATQAAAQAKPAELSRVRGDFGAVASLRTRWTYEVINLDAVPREYLMLNDAAVKGAIKGNKREIPGLRVFQVSETVVR